MQEAKISGGQSVHRQKTDHRLCIIANAMATVMITAYCVVPEEPEVVKLIFDLYLKGYSILGIIDELDKREIVSPSGKQRWCKRSIDTILSNEKYTGDVLVLKTYSSGFPNNKRVVNSGVSESHPLYIADNHHEAIITKSTFDAVQAEKVRRSNVRCNADGTKQRSDTRYTMKKN